MERVRSYSQYSRSSLNDSFTLEHSSVYRLAASTIYYNKALLQALSTHEKFSGSGKKKLHSFSHDLWEMKIQFEYLHVGRDRNWGTQTRAIENRTSKIKS